jgi:hypothetical protein
MTVICTPVLGVRSPETLDFLCNRIQNSRAERDGVGCWAEGFWTRLWQPPLVDYVQGQCWLAKQVVPGWVSEEVGTLNLMLCDVVVACLLSMTLLIRCPINWVVCGVKIVFNIHCLDFLQYTCLNCGSPVNDKEYDYTENLNEDLSSRLLSPGID